MDLKTKTAWANDITAAGQASMRQRSLDDLPQDRSPGVRQVALLTAITRVMEEQLPLVEQALENLEELANWKGSFLVADKAQFNRRTAPYRKYESLRDFYDKELATTWRAWERLLTAADATCKEAK